MGLKELAYRATRHPLVARALARVPVDISELRGERGPFAIAVTIDVEAGHVTRDERRVWQGSSPSAFEGYTRGVPNLLEVLGRHAIQGTFFVSPHGLAAPAPIAREVRTMLAELVAAGHEVGLHLHPSSDAAILEKVGRATEPRALLRAGKELLEDAVGRAVSSFRWGNWALDRTRAHVLVEEGFTVDSSAVPRLRDRKRMYNPRFDWHDYDVASPAVLVSGLVEVPIATFRAMGAWLRADPIHAPLLPAALDAYRERSLPFVLMTHSSEATYDDGSPTAALRDLAAFLATAMSAGDVVASRVSDIARSWC